MFVALPYIFSTAGFKDSNIPCILYVICLKNLFIALFVGIGENGVVCRIYCVKQCWIVCRWLHKASKCLIQQIVIIKLKSTQFYAFIDNNLKYFHFFKHFSAFFQQVAWNLCHSCSSVIKHNTSYSRIEGVFYVCVCMCVSFFFLFLLCCSLT